MDQYNNPYINRVGVQDLRADHDLRLSRRNPLLSLALFLQQRRRLKLLLLLCLRLVG